MPEFEVGTPVKWTTGAGQLDGSYTIMFGRVAKPYPPCGACHDRNRTPVVTNVGYHLHILTVKLEIVDVS